MIKNLILGMMLFSSLMPSLVSAREKLSINLGWKYHSGDIANAAAPTFDDASWQSLDLPHDASVYGPFLKEGNGASSRNGYRPLGKGWYRKAIYFNPQWQGINQGVANDDMMSHEPWQANSRTTYQGKCQLIVRSKAATGKITIKAKAKGLKPLTTIINVK